MSNLEHVEIMSPAPKISILPVISGILSSLFRIGCFAPINRWVWCVAPGLTAWEGLAL